MTATENCRGFHWTSRAYYARSALPARAGVVDEIMIGHYPPGGGSSGEFAIRWTMLAGELTPRLEVFGGAWAALTDFPDLLNWLAETDRARGPGGHGVRPPGPTPEQVATELKRLGIEDLTRYSAD